MADVPARSSDHALSDSGRAKHLAWLLVAPAAYGLASLVAKDGISVPHAVGDLLAFGIGTTAGLVALVLASPARVPGPVLIALALAGVAPLALANAGAPLPPPLVNLCLLAGAHAVGGSIGRRVRHAGHLLPACVVAAVMDVASVLSPGGPSHAIASSDHALSVTMLVFPVPGAPAVSPVLGVGDLVFVALVLAVAERHRVSRVRAAGCCIVGTWCAGALSAALSMPVPALVTIAGAVIAALPEARRLQPSDRRVAGLSVAVAGAVFVGVVLKRAFGG